MVVGEAHQEISGYLRGPFAGRVRGDPGELHSACRDFDDEQDVEPAEHGGVDTGEVGGDDRLCLGADELRPRWPCAVATRVEASGPKDLPHGGRSDSLTETMKFAVHSPVAPCRVLSGEADDQAPEVGIDGRTARLAGRWLGPVAGDEASVPADHRCRAHDRQRPTTSSLVHEEVSRVRIVRSVSLNWGRSTWRCSTST